MNSDLRRFVTALSARQDTYDVLDVTTRDGDGFRHLTLPLGTLRAVLAEIERLHPMERRARAVRDSASGDGPVVDPAQRAAIHTTARIILGEDLP